MVEQQTSPTREVWEQWDWIWHIASYTTIGIVVTIIIRRNLLGDQLPVFLVIIALLAIWYIPLIAYPVSKWRDTPIQGLLYFSIGIVLWGILFAMNESSTMLIAMFYPVIFSRFPIKWAIAIVIAQMVSFFVLYLIFHPSENWLIVLMIVVGMLIVAIMIGLFISALVSQSIERQRLLDELTQTRTSLLKAEREAGVLAERQRLSRDIHDTLAQQFTSIIMHLSAARLGNTAEIETSVQQAEQAARDGLAESRRIISNMRPSQLEEASLVESIEKVAVRWSLENKVQVETAVTGSPHALQPNTETALLRITQEALHNIKKHAKASKVAMTLSYMADLIALDIVDDGKGFDTNRNSRGFGLKTMQERAEALNGTFTVESELGNGTAVAVSLPIVEE